MRKQDLSKLIVVLLLFLIFPRQTLADTNSDGFSQEVDGYQVELVFATEQPQTGPNELAIKLHNPHGQPLNNAIVKVSVIRPDAAQHSEAVVDNHNQIPVNNHDEAGVSGHGETGAHGETNTHEANLDSHAESSASDSHEAEGDHHGEVENLVAQLSAGPAAGHYIGQVDFTDTGAWLVNINFVAEDEAKEANFVVEAARHSSTWWVINGFLGINAVVIGVAAILKKKSIKTRKGKGTSSC